MKYNVGDKVFNVDYLDYMGDPSKWMKIGFKPFYNVAGTGVHRFTGEDLFSVEFVNVRSALDAPMNHSKIFAQKTGLDMKRGQNQHLSTTKCRSAILELLDAKHKLNISKEVEYNSVRIQRLKNEIEEIKNRQNTYIETCDKHRLDILAEIDI